MVTPGWVRWSQWSGGEMLGFGQMPKENVQRELRDFEREARKLLKSTDADHVLYGVKLYDDTGELEEIKFYQEPMDDERFYRDVASVPGVIVYAVHKMK